MEKIKNRGKSRPPPTSLKLWVCLAALLCLGAAGFAAEADTNLARLPWPDCLVPLPQEMAVPQAVRMPPSAVGLIVAADASAMITQAVAALQAAYQARSGCVPNGSAFTIRIGRLSADGRLNGVAVEGADRIAQLKYADQAYIIRPTGSNCLAVAAWNDQGLFYGVQTLTQLLTARLTPAAAIIPLAVITDWPDLDQRGLWNCGHATPGFIPWLAGFKINFAGTSWPIDLGKGVTNRCPPLPLDLIRQARDHAFHLVLHLPHFDYWPKRGLAKSYPELIGRGDSAVNPALRFDADHARQYEKCRAPCASNPLLQQIIAEWIAGAARQGAREVGLWLTEFTPCQCACENCLKNGPRQFQMETAACLAAIQAIQPRYPDMVCRIFYTLGATPKDVQDARECLAMLPAGIKVDKVYGRSKPFDDYAMAGNWVASYSGCELRDVAQIGCFLRFAPVTEARQRIQSCLDARWSAVYSLSYFRGGADKGLWERSFHDYLIQALAEWSWNAQGRDVRQFNQAWLTRRGADGNAALLLQWLDRVQPVECALQPSFSALAGAPKILQQPAAEVFTGIATPEKYGDMIQTVELALPLAEQAGADDFIAETRYLLAYLRLLQGLYDFTSARKSSAPDAANAQSAAAIQVRASVARLMEIFDWRVAALADVPEPIKQELQQRHRQPWEKIGSAIGN